MPLPAETKWFSVPTHKRFKCRTNRPFTFFSFNTCIIRLLRSPPVPLQIDTEAPQSMVPLSLRSVSTLVPLTFVFRTVDCTAPSHSGSLTSGVPYLARPLSNIATADHLTPHLRLLQRVPTERTHSTRICCGFCAVCSTRIAMTVPAMGCSPLPGKCVSSRQHQCNDLIYRLHWRLYPLRY